MTASARPSRRKSATSILPNSVDGIPGFLTRKTETDISMDAGKTLVISGLLNLTARNNVEKLWGFGDLPVFGRFFRDKVTDVTDRELVIFVTPTVYDEHSELNQSMVRKQQEDVEAYMERVDLQILE